MPDQPQPTSSPRGETRKMALTETERKLIEQYRAKTAGDREFNAGLDHAIECIEAYGERPRSTDPKMIEAEFLDLLARINKARRDV